MKKEDSEGICKICGQKAQFKGFVDGYYKTCSKECAYDLRMIESKITKIEKYGNPNYNNIEKIKKTKILKYCNENYNNRIKAEKTCIKKYNVDNPSKNLIIQNKIQESFLKKYGVKHPMQNEKIFKKQQLSGFKAKLYNNIIYRGSYELDFIKKFNDKIEIQNAPRVKYIFDGQDKIYYPDFYIPSLNLIIEIKNSWLNKYDKKKINKKEQAVIKKGFRYIKILDKDYSEFEKLI